MTTPLLETTWAPEGWDDDKPCELVVQFWDGHQIHCDEPVSVVFRYRCCGYTKPVCAKHWAELKSVDDCNLECLGCGRRYHSIHEAAMTHWRV